MPNHFRTFVIIFAMLFIALLRFALLDFANFAPIAATGIFGIYFLKQKYWGIAFALVALLISDIVLQVTKGYGLYIERSIDYLGIAIGLLIAWLIIKQTQHVGTALLGAVIGSLAFFLISNFGVWAFGNMYEKTFVGLLTCYKMGIPFYKNTLIGDLFFTAMFVGTFSLLEQNVPQLQVNKNSY